MGLLKLGPEGRTALGAEGRGRIVRDYSLPAIAERYQALYQDVLEAAPRGAHVR